ncbi:FGGY family carbohydrate kinase [Brevibacterium jeotgali]|uniref:Xylulokinase n=1 Tax=Brevibacterium jeotgali TaxID=1262550 RepID=A0A2H1L5L1_9MICO|nr:FGGY family carbohydrate kinase [Brevibacterium jeotgali]TWB98522.1 xylulokinase [Brevibacterium jeotgali]SMY12025.1 xylulokinase [Brevibacterium jeotgali]
MTFHAAPALHASPAVRTPSRAHPGANPSGSPVLAIDLGSSHVKAALIGRDGCVVGEAEAPLTTDRGPHGVRQQSIGEWRSALREVILACTAAGPDVSSRSSGPAAQPLAAIALTGQMQDLILLDDHGDPTHPVVLYSDTRARRELTELLAANPSWAPGIAVAPHPDCDSVPPKLLHLARTEPQAVAASSTAHFSAAGWAAHALCGAHVCDRLTASTTSAYDPRTDEWLRLRTAEGRPLVPAHLSLPRRVDPGTVGHASAAAARTFGVPAGTPVVMALGDAGSATDGMVGSAAGSVYLHLGTTGWVAYVDPEPAEDLQRPADTGELVDRHRLAHPAGHLVIARLPEAGEALERARRTLPGTAAPHSPAAHDLAEAALAAAADDDGAGQANARDYADAVASMASAVAGLLERLGVRPSRLPATGGVVRSPGVRRMLEDAVGVPLDLIPDAEAGLVSCARTAFDALGIRHSVLPLVDRADEADRWTC